MLSLYETFQVSWKTFLPFENGSQRIKWLTSFCTSEHVLILPITGIEDLVQSFMKKTVDVDNSSIWQCIQCGKTSKFSTNIKDHVEAHHIDSLQIECVYVGKYLNQEEVFVFTWEVTNSIYNAIYHAKINVIISTLFKFVLSPFNSCKWQPIVL